MTTAMDAIAIVVIAQGHERVLLGRQAAELVKRAGRRRGRSTCGIQFLTCFIAMLTILPSAAFRAMSTARLGGRTAGLVERAAPRPAGGASGSVSISHVEFHHLLHT